MASKHTVVQGETMVKIAKLYGFHDWRTIWDHGDNQALRDTRDDPSTLHPGDEVSIPDKTPKEVEVQTGGKHAFRVKVLKAFLRLVLKDDMNEPFRDTDWTLEVAGKELSGKTDGDGLLTADVPADAGKAQLTLKPRGKPEIVWPLSLGELDPIDTATGVQGRLVSLGYRCPVDGDLATDATRAAVKAFQKDCGLETTGEVDAGTRASLRDCYEAM